MRMLLFVFLFSTVSFSQEKKEQPAPVMRQMQFNAESAVILRELGAVVAEEKGIVSVKFLPPKDRRPKEAAGEDVENGDEVGMANGKRVSTAAELRKIYDEAAVGSEFKLGVRRNGQAHIVRFVRKDPKDMSGGMMVVGGDGKEGSTKFLPALGIGLEQRGQAVVIARTLPNVPEGLKEGDEIQFLNGSRISKVEDLMKAYEEVKIGDNLKFGLLRAGSKAEFSAVKKNPPGQMMFRAN